jgi:hypothetical protein
MNCEFLHNKMMEEQCEVSWQAFLRDFPSKKQYEARIESLKFFHATEGKRTMEESLIEYIEKHHNNGTSATTLNSWLSIFGKYWRYTGRGTLSVTVPILQDSLKKWTKTHKTKQASVFTKQDLGKSIQFILIHA